MLTDVFAVQDEITRSIVEVLKVKLLPSEEDALRKSPTADIDAYQLYLRGQQLFRARSRHAYEVARRVFAQAVALDPEFARAHAGIAECEACLALHHGELLAIEQTLATAERSLRLEPTLAAAHVARGLALLAQGQLDEAQKAYERAIALEPEHFDAHYAFARLCFQRGRKEEAARTFRRAAALRPTDMFALLILMGIESELGQLEKSVATARLLLARAERELERQPESGRAAYAAAAALVSSGRSGGRLALRRARPGARAQRSSGAVQCRLHLLPPGRARACHGRPGADDAGRIGPSLGLAGAGCRLRPAAGLAALRGPAATPPA